VNLHDWLTQFSGLLWPFLANHLWQATLFSLLPIMAALALWRGSARGRHAAWMIAALKFALPATLAGSLAGSLGLSLGSSKPGIAQIAEPIGYWWIADDTVGLDSGHNEMLCVFTLIWLAGVTLILAVWIRRRLRFSRAIKAGAMTTLPREKAGLERARLTLGFFGAVELVTTPGLTQPGVAGVLKPAILLPRGMSDGLTDQELDAVLLHELVHIKRRDNLVSNACVFLCSIFWFHPLVWLIDRRLLCERERACDEAVVSLGASTEAYAASLLKVLQFCLGRKTAGVSYASGSNLRRRINRIMAGNSDKRVDLAQRLILSGLLGGLLLFSLVAGLTGRITVSDASTTAQSNKPLGGVPGRVPEGLPLGAPGSLSQGSGLEQETVRSSRTLEALKNAPEVAVEYQTPEGAPAAITQAFVRFVEFAKSDDAPGPSHAVQLKLTLQNNDQKNRIALVFVSLRTPRSAFINTGGVNPLLEPRDSRTIELGAAPCYGDPKTLVVRLTGLLFEDGTSWGKVLLPPPPPPPPPPSRPAAAERVEWLDEDKQAGSSSAVVIRRVSPKMPPLAIAAQVEGEVVVEVTIDEGGNVESARAWRGHPLLRDAAVSAARGWKFKPTVVDGTPVKVVANLTFNFAL
jgi:TonB family protein